MVRHAAGATGRWRRARRRSEPPPPPLVHRSSTAPPTAGVCGQCGAANGGPQRCAPHGRVLGPPVRDPVPLPRLQLEVSELQLLARRELYRVGGQERTAAGCLAPPRSAPARRSPHVTPRRASSPRCFPNQGVEAEHSPLFGYTLDGFGMFGPRSEGGKLVTNADLDECHGHRWGSCRRLPTSAEHEHELRSAWQSCTRGQRACRADAAWPPRTDCGLAPHRLPCPALPCSHVIEWDGKQVEMYHYHLNTEYPCECTERREHGCAAGCQPPGLQGRPATRICIPFPSRPRPCRCRWLLPRHASAYQPILHQQQAGHPAGAA